MVIEIISSDMELLDEIHGKEYNDEITCSTRFLTKNAYFVRFTASKKTIDLARILHKTLNSLNHTSYQIIQDDASALFNNKLYPLINTFERLLRKFLFLVSLQFPNDKRLDDILNKIQDLTLREVFNTLFTDRAFIDEVKIGIKKQTSFTKADIIESIDCIDENTVWSRLTKAGYGFDIEEDYKQVNKYRNDIMHAHMMHYTDYLKARKLFEKLNKQMGSLVDSLENKDITFEAIEALRQIASEVVKNIDWQGVIEVCKALSQSLAEMKKICAQTDATALSNALGPVNEYIGSLSDEEKYALECEIKGDATEDIK